MFTYTRAQRARGITMNKAIIARTCFIFLAMFLSLSTAFGQKKKEDSFGSFQPFKTSSFSKTNFKTPATAQSSSSSKAKTVPSSGSQGYMPPPPAMPPKRQTAAKNNTQAQQPTTNYSNASYSGQDNDESEQPAAQEERQPVTVQTAAPASITGPGRQQQATAPGGPLQNYQLADNQSSPQTQATGFGREQRPMARTPAEQAKLRMLLLVFLICGALFIFMIAKAVQQHMQSAEEKRARERQEDDSGSDGGHAGHATGEGRPREGSGKDAAAPAKEKKAENRDYSRFMPPELRGEVSPREKTSSAEKSFAKNDNRRYMPPELLEESSKTSDSAAKKGEDKRFSPLEGTTEDRQKEKRASASLEKATPARDADNIKFAASAMDSAASGKARETRSDVAAPALDRNGLLDGKYKILGEIGRGGMAVVYAATEVALDRKVALKKMRDEIKLDIRERKRFIKEARTTANLRHRHIVSIYTIIEEPDIYMVFEHIDGKTLEDYLCKYEKLPIKHTLAVGEKILSALIYAHSKGVVHRDLKPSNVMVTAEGQVKVMDFGIARAAKDGLTRVTGTPEICGTLAYMAPEQEMGRAEEASDLFAFGVTMYEMATGELPFRGPNFLAQKEERVFEPPRKLLPAMPPEFAKIIERCLEPSTTARYKSAEEVLKDLKAVPL